MKVLDCYPWIRDRFSGVREAQCGARCDADCPFGHGTAHLRFWLGDDGRLLFGCYRDCPKLEMLRAVGATWSDCFPGGRMPDRPKQEIAARYPYHDEAGCVLYQTIRLEPGTRGRDKDFRQRRPDPTSRDGWRWNLDGVRRVLYRLPELLAAKPDRPVLIVGGEKDADTLRGIGLVATTNVCGERAEWLESYTETLAGRDVVVIEDADAAGRRHTSEVCGSLLTAARSVRRCRLPVKDATAFVCALRANDVTAPAELRRIVWENVESAPKWAPAAA